MPSAEFRSFANLCLTKCPYSHIASMSTVLHLVVASAAAIRVLDIFLVHWQKSKKQGSELEIGELDERRKGSCRCAIDR